MNPLLPGVNEKAVYKDAVFFSGHKFVGGVQTPGKTTIAFIWTSYVLFNP